MEETTAGLRVTYVDGSPSALVGQRLRVEVVGGADDGLRRDFEQRLLRIGAHPASDVALTDPRVSKAHLEVEVADDGLRLRDLGSTNGTWVGACRVEAGCVRPGTVVTVGGSQLRISVLAETYEVPLAAADRCGDLIGASVAMRALYALLDKVAPTASTVLICGETGTGKELVAEALHRGSKRGERPFVVVDCAGLPETLVESELFGHERGAFTGASRAFAGAFERADGGTVFLDELGELPLELQPKLLRVLERREVRRVGGAQTLPLDVRFLAATNRDLAAEVNAGRFREDLYYRLAVVRLRLPALRERRDDVPLLAAHFARELGAEGELDSSFVEQLQRQAWPGNVRELRNAVERWVLMRDPAEVPAPAAAAVESSAGAELRVAVDPTVPYKRAKQAAVEAFERRYLEALLAAHGDNLTAAARAAGVDRMSIYKLLRRLGIERAP